MKYILFFLFVPLFIFSQSDLERKKITNSTTLINSNSLFERNSNRQRIRDAQIVEYLKSHHLPKEIAKNIKLIQNKVPIFYKEDNAGSSRTINANKLYPGGSLGLSVTGNGITAGEWDGGKVRNTHQELTGRVTLSDGASTLSEHSTHVAGTIVASGVQASAKGISYQASLKSYDWNGDTGEITTFANNGYLVSNHSYGYDTANLPPYIFGQYNDDSEALDDIAYTYPYYQMVKAAGNDRSDTSLGQVNNKEGYDLLTGECNSKNSITVAAVNELLIYTDNTDVVMSSFSNYGPTDDGRIKPDIAAKGVGVYSCVSSSNSAYSTFQGTSMAAPAITGLIVLLQKHYSNFNAGNYMKSASVRGLLTHSAREAGSNPGPDYSFGYGLANGLDAANIITNNGTSSLIQEKSLPNGEIFQQNIVLNSVQDLKVSISWTDPAAPAITAQVEDDRTSVLVNNLDLKVVKDGVIYYPWKLDPDNPSAQASNNSDNEVDNIEKIDIFDAQPGIYTIQVSHKGTLFNNSQDYTLIASGTAGVSLNTRNYIYDNSIFIYPNPAKGILNYTLNNEVVLTSITINDVSGKQIYKSGNTLNNSIDISSLSSGVYFVTFKSDKGSVIKKFIKE